MTIVVVGIPADGWAGLPPAARTELTRCDVLLGGRRQLDLVPDTGAEQVPWPSPLLPALDGLLREYAGRRVGVLASGDPLLSGIGGTLVRRLGAKAVRVVPSVSSVALARARLGWPADGAETAEVVRITGTDVSPVLRAAGDGGRMLVLSADGDTPGAVAALLARHGFGDSRLTLLENLGAADERRLDGLARDWAHEPVAPLNVLAVAVAGPEAPPLTPGLPDDAFAHDGQLTKSLVRATALAALAPRPGELLWDVGSGSGSVAVEWARLHPANRAVAVEARADRAERIRHNAERHGAAVRVTHGSAPAVLGELPRPDAVFVGGGVSEPGLLPACHDVLGPGGRIVAHGVTIEAERALAEAHAAYGGELTRLSVQRAAPLGTFTSWEPARPVTQWSVRI
ncbi:precorrin-6y C5,15-methyltransferase (decarboxylating) subunit CbiE [Saccharomonospora piscinae]|uniref:precorrin-6y C5,15-methyltransferase (decarboxylating) subunit CbiE n=1 Tax=Saccharomonospora piscinae TaxID=687388 RepID=UPI00207BB913|nr:precorrin-6y C5,15-methyltransferase (decarboxylating) subunit CbiE [Saccharomonospora piscinae]